MAFLGHALAVLAGLALLASLWASREQPPRNRRVTRIAAPVAPAPRNTRRADASVSGVRSVGMGNRVTRARRAGRVS